MLSNLRTQGMAAADGPRLGRMVDARTQQPAPAHPLNRRSQARQGSCLASPDWSIFGVAVGGSTPLPDRRPRSSLQATKDRMLRWRPRTQQEEQRILTFGSRARIDCSRPSDYRVPGAVGRPSAVDRRYFANLNINANGSGCLHRIDSRRRADGSEAGNPRRTSSARPSAPAA